MPLTPPPATPLAPAPAPAPRKLAMLGRGSAAECYLAAIEADPAFALGAVCDLDEAAPAGSRAVGVPTYREHRALLAAHHDLGGAVVAGLGGAHAALCRDLLAAGLPVCVEQPLTAELSDARALTAIAAERSLVLFTAFRHRYNSAVLELLRACAGGSVSKVRVRQVERSEQRQGQDAWHLAPPRRSGGGVATDGPAAFDLVRLLFGEAELSVVRATIHRDPAGLERQAVIDLVTAGPTPRRAKVELDRSCPGELMAMEVTLADGRVLRADLPTGATGRAAPLRHEYQGVLTAFGAAIGTAGSRRDGGLAALDLVASAYRLDGDAATHVFRPTAVEAR
ncbi:Gfo/Idh/MocA family protein [Kitasatospora sp. NBC_01266]|uniref:Gfo/Idh/MocA family protein n=1 Tax=Kitasatospora sp. NBC_01266 TaxID=2903572 RepID=UPI002E335ABB|nr:Gfo/Idh/MocA family oxidoreductase [Kitasatospora sp. NBC_01266]